MKVTIEGPSTIYTGVKVVHELTYEQFCWLQLAIPALNEGLFLHITKEFKIQFNKGLKESKEIVYNFKNWVKQ